jgi:hypothetical protein
MIKTTIACKITSRLFADAALVELNAMGILGHNYAAERDTSRIKSMYLVFYPEQNQAQVLNHKGTITKTEDIYDLSQWEAFLVAVKESMKPKLDINIAGHQAEIKDGAVHFGCQSFTIPELKTMQKILAGPINGKVDISGSNISLKMVDKLIMAIEKSQGDSTYGFKVGDIIDHSMWSLPRDVFNLGSVQYSWTSDKMVYIGNTRTIEAIEMKDGVVAGLISGTANVWVSLSSLAKK